MYAPCVKDYAEVVSFICDKLVLRNQAQRIFACNEIGPSGKMRNRFVLIARDGEGGYVLWVARELLLFRLNSQPHSSGTEYIFLHYMKGKSPLDEVDKELG